MPFTRVNPLKESSFWLSYLSSLHFNEKASKGTGTQNISITKNVEDDRCPDFISKSIKTPPETLKSEQEKPMNIKTSQKLSRKGNRGSLQQEQLKAKVVAPKFMIFYDPSDPSDTSFVSSNYVKHWFPGLLVVPLPSYGIFGYVDFAFLAVLCYLNGSIIYVADSFLLWKRVNPNFHGDGSDPAIYLNTCGAGIFILNCLLCFLDWWIQYLELRHHHLATIDSFLISSNDDDTNKSIKKENDKGKATKRFDSFSLSPSSYYGLLNNFFFLIAAGLFFLQGLALQRQSRVASKSWFEFTVNFVGGLFYLLSSIFCCIESFEERANRSVQGLPRHNLFSFNFYDCDWFGWGDIIYFIASLTSLIEAFFIFFASEDFNCIFYIISNCLFLVDSIIYAIAYGLYLYDLRTSFFTGRIHASRTVSFSQLLAAESKLHDTKEGSLSSFQESPLQWKANDDGYVKIMDMHRSLYQSRIENQLNQRNMNQIDEIDENEEENQIELSTIPVQTSSKKISDEESAMWF